MGNTVAEYKDKIGGEALGISVAAKTSWLGSPSNGVPIIEEEENENPRQMIRQMEKVNGISSWIDNI